MFLALKEIKKEKSRFVMIVIVTALIAFLVYFLTGLAYGLASANTTSVEHWKADGIILSKASNQNIYASTIEEDVVKSLDLKSSESLNVASTVVSVNEDKDQFDLVLMGIEEKGKLVLPKLIEGRHIKGSQEIVLSETFKKDFDIKIGDKIKVISTGRTFDVVGFTKKSEYNTQTVGYVALEMASQEMMMYKTGDDKTDATATPTVNMPNRISAIITNEKVDNKLLKKNNLVQFQVIKLNS
jgi:putative ABC transport system permease protein